VFELASARHSVATFWRAWRWERSLAAEKHWALILARVASTNRQERSRHRRNCRRVGQSVASGADG
jgi:hypothetical protein